MTRFGLQLLAAFAGAFLALATIPPALAHVAEKAAAAWSGQLTLGPVCVGLILTNCSMEPPRISPLALILRLGHQVGLYEYVPEGQAGRSHAEAGEDASQSRQ